METTVPTQTVTIHQEQQVQFPNLNSELRIQNSLNITHRSHRTNAIVSTHSRTTNPNCKSEFSNSQMLDIRYRQAGTTHLAINYVNMQRKQHEQQESIPVSKHLRNLHSHQLRQLPSASVRVACAAMQLVEAMQGPG